MKIHQRQNLSIKLKNLQEILNPLTLPTIQLQQKWTAKVRMIKILPVLFWKSALVCGTNFLGLDFQWKVEKTSKSLQESLCKSWTGQGSKIQDLQRTGCLRGVGGGIGRHCWRHTITESPPLRPPCHQFTVIQQPTTVALIFQYRRLEPY